MAVTVHIDESNDSSGEVVQEAVTALKAGSIDAWNLDPVANSITPGANAYEKWLRYHFTALGGASAVGTLKVWGDAPSDVAATLGYNGHTVQGTYDTTKKTAYAAPAATSTRTPNAFPTSEPGSANLGIAGSLTGTLTAAGRSDYLLLQVQTTGAVVSGDTVTISFGYEVTA